MRQLDGAVVVVVGASGGLGAPIAADLRSRGAHVVGVGRHGPDLVADLRDSRAGAQVVDAVLASHGRLDGVVIASGVVAFGDLVETDPAVVEELFLTNTLGPLWFASSALDALAATKGFFCAITGVVAEQGLPGMVAYSASKGGLATALAGWRREARRRGVHVIDARPPHTETGLATRPLAGTAPRMPTGLAPADVARRIVDAIAAEEPEVPSTAF